MPHAAEEDISQTKCTSKTKINQQPKTAGCNTSGETRYKAHQVTDNHDSSDSEYAFSCQSNNHAILIPTIAVRVNGVKGQMDADSCAMANIMDFETFSKYSSGQLRTYTCGQRILTCMYMLRRNQSHWQDVSVPTHWQDVSVPTSKTSKTKWK